ncbi:hypothetical protein B0H12DRAFT_1164168 [Mycena haematopus]|nr:hypothetical protein B0H12DRAFT_1164168 [Mycena haematopus]
MRHWSVPSSVSFLMLAPVRVPHLLSCLPFLLSHPPSLVPAYLCPFLQLLVFRPLTDVL